MLSLHHTCLKWVYTILADDIVLGAGPSAEEEAVQEQVLNEKRNELFKNLQNVLIAHPSSAPLAAMFPGALPLCMSQDQLQQALEMYGDAEFMPADTAAFAASLRSQLLVAADIQADPLRLEQSTTAIPVNLHMVERSDQIVGTLRNILIWEVCYPFPACCPP